MPKPMEDKSSYTLMRSSLEPFPRESRYVSPFPQEAAQKAAKVQFRRHVDEGGKEDVDVIYIELRETTMNSDKSVHQYETSRTRVPLAKSHPLFKILSKASHDGKNKKEPYVHEYKAKPIYDSEEFERLFSSHAEKHAPSAASTL